MSKNEYPKSRINIKYKTVPVSSYKNYANASIFKNQHAIGGKLNNLIANMKEFSFFTIKLEYENFKIWGVPTKWFCKNQFYLNFP